MADQPIFQRQGSGELLKAKVRELLAMGWTMSTLSERIGIHLNTLTNWRDKGLSEARAPLVLTALAHPMFRRGPSQGKPFYIRPLQEQVGMLFDRGWTASAIADLLGVRYFEVRKWHEKGAGHRSRVIAIALSHTVFAHRPPPQRRYYDTPASRADRWLATVTTRIEAEEPEEAATQN